MSWLGSTSVPPPSSSSLRHRHNAHSSSSTTRSSPSSSITSNTANNGDNSFPRPGAKRHRRPPRKPKSASLQPSWGAKGWVREGFRRFGEHCARNQIRTLLIDCLVMTTLFYPSLAPFLDKRLHDNSGRSPTGPAPAPGVSGRNARATGSVGEVPAPFFAGPLSDTLLLPPPPLLPNVGWGPWWTGDPDGGDMSCPSAVSSPSKMAEGSSPSPSFPRPVTPTGSWVSSRAATDRQPSLSASNARRIDLVRVAWADVGQVLDGEDVAPWAPRDDEIVRAIRSLAEEWGQDTNDPSRAQCVRHLVLVGGNETGLDVAPAGDCYLVVPTEEEYRHISGSTPISALWQSNGARTDQQSEHHHEYRGVAVPFAMHGNEADRAAFHDLFSQRLTDAVAPLGGEIFTESYVPRTPTVTYISHSSASSSTLRAPVEAPRASCPPLVLFLYIVLLGALLWQLSSASKVHSRFGLAFTGVVQLCCSALMSFSILALLGWNGWGWSQGQTVLPTYVLPFVIVVVGAENMSALTKAVFSVPFAHSVPVRIGMGLSKVGVTIAVTSLTDLALLGLVWLCVHLQPVREFCIFAAVVIVTDYFMLHTFFLTVLSIDAQRLELADMIASNGGLSSHEALKREEEANKRRSQRKAQRFSWRSVLRARTAKSGSLILLLTCVGVLYYFTERRRSISTAARLYGYTPPSTASTVMSAIPAKPTTGPSDLGSLSVSEALWQAINPEGWMSVPIDLPPSSIVIFPSHGHPMLPADIRKLRMPKRALLIGRLRPLFYMLKSFLLPQAATTIALYGVLRYLLKDSSKLDAQRSRIGRGREAHQSDDESDDGANVRSGAKNSIVTNVGVNMLPASHEVDVDIIATSTNGRLAISVGIDSSVCLWRFLDEERSSGTREMLSSDAIASNDPIVAAGVSSDGGRVAVVTATGMVQIWATPDESRPEAMPVVDLCCSDDFPTAILFDDTPNGIDDPFVSSPTSHTSGSDRPTLLVALSSGCVRAVVDEGGSPRAIEVITKADTDRARVDLLSTERGPIALITTSAGTTLWVKAHGEWAATDLAASTTPNATDRVLAATYGVIKWHERPTEVIALGRRSGSVEVFDTHGQEIVVLSQAGEPVRRVAVANSFVTSCKTCDQHSTDGFFIISSTSSQVFVDRVAPRSGVVFCRCPTPRRHTPVDDATVAAQGHTRNGPIVLPPMSARMRTISGGINSLAPSTNASPMKPSLAPPQSNGDFPVSSHGTRRLSGYRNADDFSRPPSPLDRTASYGALSMSAITLDDAAASHALPPSSTQPLWADAEVVPLGAILARDGGWVVLEDGALIGVRRGGSGIDDSQWQFWALDLGAPWNGSNLQVETAGLDVLERRSGTGGNGNSSGSIYLSPSGIGTPPTSPSPRHSQEGELPMRARRAERILSLNGRASFPSSVGSFSVLTHQPLGYVAVRPFCAAGRRAALAGFGNRVGVLSLPVPMGSNTNGNAGSGTASTNINGTAAPSISISTPRRVMQAQSHGGTYGITPPPPRIAPPPPRRADSTSPSVGMTTSMVAAGGGVTVTVSNGGSPVKASLSSRHI